MNRLGMTIGIAGRTYAASESNARDLITTIYSILEQDLKTTSSIVGSIADILDDESKKNELLSSLNGFKVEVSCSSLLKVDSLLNLYHPATEPVS